MMKIPVSELSGNKLDLAVAKGLGVLTDADEFPDEFWDSLLEEDEGALWSENWRLGGPVIERNLIVLSPDPTMGWVARPWGDATEYSGPTALTAAMRCYVACHFGEEVEIPEGLS